MGISAAPPTPTAPSPGRKPISQTNSAARSEDKPAVASTGPSAQRLYGRRLGHRLSARQRELVARMLPRCAILLNDTRLDPARLFRPGLAGVALEVGFGGGEHLAVLAREKPDWGFLGCEPYLNGVAQLLVKIEEARLDNIRLYRGDARDVIERLPHASLDAVYVLFPDPWPKRRHWKRRFVAPEMLSSLARVMRGGGELRIATDSGAYAQWTLEKILTEPSFTWLASGPINWRARPQGAPETRYEAKARRAGRPIYHLRFERVRAGP